MITKIPKTTNINFAIVDKVWRREGGGAKDLIPFFVDKITFLRDPSLRHYQYLTILAESTPAP